MDDGSGNTTARWICNLMAERTDGSAMCAKGTKGEILYLLVTPAGDTTRSRGLISDETLTAWGGGEAKAINPKCATRVKDGI
jgi:hypothetical protein